MVQKAREEAEARTRKLMKEDEARRRKNALAEKEAEAAILAERLQKEQDKWKQQEEKESPLKKMLSWLNDMDAENQVIATRRKNLALAVQKAKAEEEMLI